MERGSLRLVVVIAISMVAHVLFVAVVAPAVKRQARPRPPSYFEITPIAQDDDPRNPTEAQRRQDEHYEPDDAPPDGPVVHAPEAGEQRRPDDAHFLSDRDQVVERETRSRFMLPGKRTDEPQPPLPFIAGGRAQPSTGDQRGGPAGPAAGDEGRLPDGSGDQGLDEGLSPEDERSVDLMPRYAALSDAVGGNGLDDLRNVEEGDGTLLTTARWLHAPFFQRVKEQVEQYWHPDMAFARHDPGGHVYGYRDRETVIQVVLDNEGGLVRNYVLRASGADFLDDEALRAIEQAAPFPNPPRGLVDQQSQRIVFTFGFTVELGEQPIFRVRRYR